MANHTIILTARQLQRLQLLCSVTRARKEPITINDPETIDALHKIADVMTFTDVTDTVKIEREQ